MGRVVKHIFRFFLKLTVLIVVYSLLRFEFFLWNASQFMDLEKIEILKSFVYGVRFDIESVSWLSLLVFLLSIWTWPRVRENWQEKVLSVIFIIIQLPFFWANVFDVEMINIVGRRAQKGTLFLATEGADKFLAIFKSYWAIMSLNLIFCITFIWLIWKIKDLKFKERKVTPLVFGVLILLSFVVMTIAARGGLQAKPLEFAHANIFKQKILNDLTMNSAFTVLHSTNESVLKKVEYYEKAEELLPLLNGYRTDEEANLDRQKVTHSQNPQNVVIILLESFALEYMGTVNNYEGYTPFLDSLAEKAVFFKNNFANGRQSIEALPSILMGIPSLMNTPYITSIYSSNDVPGLGTILKNYGYHTSFFHGGNTGTMYFDQFTRKAGIVNYFGAEDFPDKSEHDGTWGIYDEPFLRFFAQKLTSFSKPFFSMVFTLSSHHPYKVPEKYKKQFPAGELEIYQSIRYADYSLQKFFEFAKTQDWFQNTLFILTADHTQKQRLPQYINEVGRYRVPLIFYHQNLVRTDFDLEKITQHVDIPVSVLDFLKIKNYRLPSFGRSIFHAGEGAYVVVQIEDFWRIISKNYFLKTEPGDLVSIFSMEKGGAESTPVENKEVENDLLRKLRATKQYFNNSLIDNRF